METSWSRNRRLSVADVYEENVEVSLIKTLPKYCNSKEQPNEECERQIVLSEKREWPKIENEEHKRQQIENEEYKRQTEPSEEHKRQQIANEEYKPQTNPNDECQWKKIANEQYEGDTVSSEEDKRQTTSSIEHERQTTPTDKEKRQTTSSDEHKWRKVLDEQDDVAHGKSIILDSDDISDKGRVPDLVKSFHKHIIDCNVNAVKDLLSKGINPNATNEEDQSPLHLCVASDSLAIFKTLIMYAVCDLNIVDIAGDTPLHMICKRMNNLTQLSSSKTRNIVEILQEMAQLLVSDPRIDLNIRNHCGYTPLLLACYSKLLPIVKILLKHQADPNIPSHKGVYPIHVACEYGWLEIVEDLILYGADLNVTDANEDTPLHFAAMNNNAEVCNLLKNNSVKFNVVNRNKQRPRDLAPDLDLKNLLRGLKTSLSHPLEISCVKSIVLGNVKLGMTMCPGRNKKQHRRSLDLDIQALKSFSTDVLVLLVRQTELEFMGITRLVSEVESKGIVVIHEPITDKWIPSSMNAFFNLVLKVLELIALQKTVVISCNGGKGRTGLLVASTLVLLGLEPKEAILHLREIRHGMLYNPAQQTYLRAFRYYAKSKIAMFKHLIDRIIQTTLNSSDDVQKDKLAELLINVSSI